MKSPTTKPAGATPVHTDQPFKPDRPRSIDRYIDYFGNGGATSGTPRDPDRPTGDTPQRCPLTGS